MKEEKDKAQYVKERQEERVRQVDHDWAQSSALLTSFEPHAIHDY